MRSCRAGKIAESRVAQATARPPTLTHVHAPAGALSPFSGLDDPITTARDGNHGLDGYAATFE